MIVFKTVDQFDRNTGKKIGTTRIYDHSICDYSGEVIDYDSCNPNEYMVDHNDNDPNFGDGDGEGWLYKYENELNPDNWGYHHHELFGQTRYVFSVKEDGYTEVFFELLEEARFEKLDVYSLDHLLRWSRGRMLEKVIKSGKYKIQDFCESEEDDYETI